MYQLFRYILFLIVTNSKYNSLLCTKHFYLHGGSSQAPAGQSGSRHEGSSSWEQPRSHLWELPVPNPGLYCWVGGGTMYAKITIEFYWKNPDFPFFCHLVLNFLEARHLPKNCLWSKCAACVWLLFKSNFLTMYLHANVFYSMLSWNSQSTLHLSVCISHVLPYRCSECTLYQLTPVSGSKHQPGAGISIKDLFCSRTDILL